MDGAIQCCSMVNVGVLVVWGTTSVNVGVLVEEIPVSVGNCFRVGVMVNLVVPTTEGTVRSVGI
jgi:hypothetical protein